MAAPAAAPAAPNEIAPATKAAITDQKINRLSHKTSFLIHTFRFATMNPLTNPLCETLSTSKGGLSKAVLLMMTKKKFPNLSNVDMERQLNQLVNSQHITEKVRGGGGAPLFSLDWKKRKQLITEKRKQEQAEREREFDDKKMHVLTAISCQANIVFSLDHVMEMIDADANVASAILHQLVNDGAIVHFINSDTKERGWGTPYKSDDFAGGAASYFE